MKQIEKLPVKEDSSFVKFMKKNNIILILVLVYVAAAVLASPALLGGKKNTFFTVNNTFDLLTLIGVYGILAMGLTFVFIVGGIDLSIGYQVAFCAAMFAVMARNGVNVILAMIITMICGCIVGYINGSIVTRIGIPPLIGTLAVMTALKGIVYIICPDSLSLGSATLNGATLSSVYKMAGSAITLPVLLIIILTVVFSLFLRYSVTGSNLYIVGGNYEAGLLSGINPDRLSRIAYTLGGLCSSICGLLLCFRTNTATYNMGDGIDITAICAIVVGGVKMQGGRGNMGMCLMGVAVIQIITNLMDKLHYSTAVVSLVTGIVVILVLILDKITSAKDVTME